MTDEIKLPITNQVPFQAYQIRGFESAILLANDRNSERFLFNNCINCYLRKKKDGKLLFDYTCNYTPWFSGQDVFLEETIPIDTIETSFDSIIRLVVGYLNRGIYVSGFFNEKHIPHKNAYGKWDFKHSFLLYGYNGIEKLFYAIGYTDNAKFELYQIPYQNFANGILNVEAPVLWLRYFQQDKKMELDLERLYLELGDYLHSDYTVNGGIGKHRDDIYGVRAHRIFQSLIVEAGRFEENLDVRHSRFFYENKAFMLKRLSFLQEKEYITQGADEYAVVAQKSKMIHFLFLKYNMKRTISTIKSINQLLTDVNHMDEDILSNVYEELTTKITREKRKVHL